MSHHCPNSSGTCRLNQSKSQNGCVSEKSHFAWVHWGFQPKLFLHLLKALTFYPAQTSVHEIQGGFAQGELVYMTGKWDGLMVVNGHSHAPTCNTSCSNLEWTLLTLGDPSRTTTKGHRIPTLRYPWFPPNTLQASLTLPCRFLSLAQ